MVENLNAIKFYEIAESGNAGATSLMISKNFPYTRISATGTFCQCVKSAILFFSRGQLLCFLTNQACSVIRKRKRKDIRAQRYVGINSVRVLCLNDGSDTYG